VFDGWSKALNNDNLTIVVALGNHDIELALPRVQAVVRWLVGEQAPESAEDTPRQSSLRTFPSS
jgi:hypothetical protein